LSIFTCDNKDEFIYDIFPNSNQSYFVDVGASDGIYGSNTFSLEKRGWGGICIEPHEDIFEELEKNRSCKVNSGLVSLDRRLVDFSKQKYEPHIKGNLGKKIYGGFSHAWRGGSGISENLKSPVEAKSFEKVKIKTKTLTDILDEEKAPRYIELLDIDTEGNDLNVILGIDWDKYRFGCILVESNNKEIEENLRDVGYTMQQEFSQEYLYVDLKKEGLIENVKNVQNIGYWSDRIFGETCLPGASP
tara:strand:- start:23936 stop:24673 length:738 start_codon:yes stop_codon:yes gene_type:complete